MKSQIKKYPCTSLNNRDDTENSLMIQQKLSNLKNKPKKIRRKLIESQCQKI